MKPLVLATHNSLKEYIFSGSIMLFSNPEIFVIAWTLCTMCQLIFMHRAVDFDLVFAIGIIQPLLFSVSAWVLWASSLFFFAKRIWCATTLIISFFTFFLPFLLKCFAEVFFDVLYQFNLWDCLSCIYSCCIYFLLTEYSSLNMHTISINLWSLYWLQML